MTAPQPPIAQPHHASHPARHTPPRPRFSHRPLRHAAITLLAGLLAASTLPAYADTPPPRMVTDMGGAVVSIPQDNGPIADLWYAHNEITVMLGGAGRIAVSAESPTESPWLFRFFPALLKARTGIRPDTASAEDLLARHIALVFVSSRAKAEELRRAGLPALSAEYATQADLLRSLDMTAQALGTDEATRTAALYHQRMAETLTLLHTRLASLPEQNRPRVLHIARLEPLQVDGGNTLVDAWITAAGGRNAATVSGNHRPVSAEQILAWNPDIVIVDASAGAVPATSPLMALPALQAGRWWRNPRGIFAWDRYGCEDLLQLYWAATRLHPELFADIDIRSVALTFYQTFFYVNLTDDEMTRILSGNPPSPDNAQERKEKSH
ncbi:MAG: ABC transporter substrate-binding protein [Acetobacter papayae]|uniref:ABC transporter substrate-binding protein n=1 Tax=Acetobacter papayae TaxID=1076592 RepID=UPI0039E9E80E